MKNAKLGYPSCSTLSEGAHCAQQQHEREPPSRSSRVASCWLGEMLLFLMATEGTRGGEGRVLELVPFSVWDENHSEDTQLAPTKYFLG